MKNTHPLTLETFDIVPGDRVFAVEGQMVDFYLLKTNAGVP